MDKLLELHKAALLEQPNTAEDWFTLIYKIRSGTYRKPAENSVHFMTRKQVEAEALEALGRILDGG